MQLPSSWLGLHIQDGLLMASSCYWLLVGPAGLSTSVPTCGFSWSLGSSQCGGLGSRGSIPPVSVLNTLGILQSSKEPASKCCFICATLIVQLVTKAAQIQREGLDSTTWGEKQHVQEGKALVVAIFGEHLFAACLWSFSGESRAQISWSKERCTSLLLDLGFKSLGVQQPCNLCFWSFF